MIKSFVQVKLACQAHGVTWPDPIQSHFVSADRYIDPVMSSGFFAPIDYFFSFLWWDTGAASITVAYPLLRFKSCQDFPLLSQQVKVYFCMLRL